MIGGEAEATQISARCSSFDGSRRKNSGYGVARPVGRWRAAVAAMSRSGGALRVPATTGGEARLTGGGTAWISH